MTTTYPHRRDASSTNSRSICVCGDVTLRGYTPDEWGSDCPLALREALSAAEKERDDAVMAAAVGEAVIAAMHNEPVSDFMQSFGPVMEAQMMGHTIALLRADNEALWRVVKDACAYLRVTDDDENDWPKLAAYADAIVKERNELRATLARLQTPASGLPPVGTRWGDIPDEVRARLPVGTVLGATMHYPDWPSVRLDGALGHYHATAGLSPVTYCDIDDDRHILSYPERS